MKLVYCSANIYLLLYISHFLRIISYRHLKHTADKCTCAWEFKKNIHFYHACLVKMNKMAAARSPCGGFKTRVLHFKVKKTTLLKDKKWKEKVQTNVQFSFCGGSFSSRNRPQRNSTLFSSRRSCLKCNEGREVCAEFLGTFCTLWPRKVRF